MCLHHVLVTLMVVSLGDTAAERVPVVLPVLRDITRTILAVLIRSLAHGHCAFLPTALVSHTMVFRGSIAVSLAAMVHHAQSGTTPDPQPFLSVLLMPNRVPIWMVIPQMPRHTVNKSMITHIES